VRVRLGRAPRGLIVGAVTMYKQPRDRAAACTSRPRQRSAAGRFAAGARRTRWASRCRLILQSVTSV